jgi:subtilisin family serine protease
MPTIAKPISTAAEAHDKLDPRLCALVELDDHVFAPVDQGAAQGVEGMRGASGGGRFLERRSGPLAFLTGPRSWFGDFDRRGRGAGEATVSRVPVFVTVDREGALDDVALRAGGLQWRCRAGRMATTDVNLGQLRALEEDDRVVAVEWTGGAKPLATTGEPQGGVAPRGAVGLPADPERLDGQGVVIGIVDIDGIDVYHPDFLTADGRSRVTAIWDQNERQRRGRLGRTPAPYGYGTAYDKADLWVELDPNRRVRYANVAHAALKVSHGTMVAGVAAGGGVADAAARGVAPGADLVFVSTPASGAGALAAMTEIAEAVDFVLRTAGDQPCVVNVSLGDDLGPRDGTSPVERMFDEMLAARPGRAIVVAAGNAHEARTHLVGTVGGASATSTFFCDAPAASARNAVLEIWYDALPADDPGIAVRIESPDGAVLTPTVEADGLPRAFDLGATRVLVASVRRYPASDNALLRIEMFPVDEAVGMSAGAFTIRLYRAAGPCTYFAWLDHPRFQLRAAESAAALPPPVTLTSPGTSRLALTVGACTQASAAPVSFSGRGRGRHGLAKPEVLACGVCLRTASAATPNRSYASFTGTSGAAPLVTGTVALAFQYAKEQGLRLRPEETRAVLRAAAGRPPGSPDAEPGRLRWMPDAEVPALFAALGIGREAPPQITPAASPVGSMKERDQMEHQQTNRGPRDGQDMTRGQDDQQIAVGFYILYQADLQIGRLLVVPERVGTSEHWDLWSAFRQPSSLNTRQELIFSYVGQPISVEEFKRNIDTGSTYIIAQCQQQTNP